MKNDPFEINWKLIDSYISFKVICFYFLTTIINFIVEKKFANYFCQKKSYVFWRPCLVATSGLRNPWKHSINPVSHAHVAKMTDLLELKKLGVRIPTWV